MDVREEVSKRLGSLLLANIELNAQLAEALAEIERLKANQKEPHDDSK